MSTSTTLSLPDFGNNAMAMMLGFVYEERELYWDLVYRQERHGITSANALADSDDDDDDSASIDDGKPLHIWFGPPAVIGLVSCLGQLCPAPRNASVLDAGCGNGHLTRILCQRGFARLVACDNSKEAVRVCR